MSEELRNIYKGAGALDRYFDQKTPVDLFRGRKKGDYTELMQPTLIGWVAALRPRNPDVLIQNDKGGSPQYINGDFSTLATEGKDKSLTSEILRNADKYIVKGCLTMAGLHRGVSVFDKKNPGLRNFDWYKLPANANIHPALAVTRDKAAKTSGEPIHYTIVPKNDMPLALFLQCLKSMEAQTALD